MPNAVKMFKDCSEELGAPNKLLFNPVLSLGTRKKIIVIKKILRAKRNNFNMG